jgi:putative addiction module component (TIGR02574 family)
MTATFTGAIHEDYFHRHCKINLPPFIGGVMGNKAEVLIKEALALPDAELASLINRLLAALEPEKDAEVYLSWAAEIERRGTELQQGLVTAVPWNEVREKALRLAC